MKLSEAFSSRESRVDRVIVFVDMAESTAMKEREPEAAWLTTYGWYFDKITESIERNGGQIVKYLGDGVMAVFTDEHAVEAINAAIQIQEAIAVDNARDSVACNCSVGIATGEVVQYDSAQGSDYIGTVSDKAARLCSAASPKAIFVDRETISNAMMRRVRSRLGEAMVPQRTAREYQGESNKIALKGLSNAVEYHEILWDQQHYGVKSSAIPSESRLAATQAPTGAIGETKSNGSKRASVQHAGIVRRWDSEKKVGFIETSSNESYYFDGRFAIQPEVLSLHDKVYFVPREPLQPGKKPVASAVLSVGQKASGRVKNIGEKGFGFLTVMDRLGNSQDLYIHLGNKNDNLERGAEVEFLVVENEVGVCARNATVLH